MRNSVIWGCPTYIPIQTASSPENLQGGVNRNAPGYGMNWWPSFTSTYPTPAQSTSFPPQTENFDYNGPNGQGKWYKLTQFKNPSDRALVGDARWFYLEARTPAATGFIPGQRINWYPNLYSTNNATGTRQTTFDFYRHGTYPPVEDPDLTVGKFSPDGGKVSFNILYADSHVATATDRQTGYRVLRMRFPL